MASLAELYATLEHDPVRSDLGFDPEFEKAQRGVLNASTDAERERYLLEWLAKYQPCLFGKIAARFGMIECLFVSETDIEKGDGHVRDLIAAGHRRWWTASLAARKSGFVVLCWSEKVALARPNEALLRFSQRLASLYFLRESIDPDTIYTDQTFLEIPARPISHLIRWEAGVNVFASAGDRRWWQHHRIPGGLAFSVNSVGHMVKSAESSEALSEVTAALGIAADLEPTGKVNSLGKALELAMSTIANASESVSGKATWLLPADEFEVRPGLECPVQLGEKLKGKWHCEYRGAYHTDVTLPTLYFRDAVEKPADASSQLLDFTYLFWDSEDNPAFQTMGKGQQFRDDRQSRPEVRHDEESPQKQSRMAGSSVSPKDYPEIAEILRQRSG